MILEPSRLDTDLHGQVCIIGSGAAGVTLALELKKHDLDVVLVAGGGFEERPADRRLHDGVIDPAGSHEPLADNRCRAFGGSTKRWGGRLVPFDPIDFERRSFVPLSGWPIRYEEVAREFPRAAALCEVVADDFTRHRHEDDFDLPDTLGGTIDTTGCERWSTPTDFGVRYRQELAATNMVRVLLDHHAVDLRLSDDLRAVSGVTLMCRGGKPIHVTADVFILATGGIENARLLLASRSQIPSGVGNHSGMVGRCYMSHVAGTYGYLTLHGTRKPRFYRLEKDRHGAYYRRRFRLTDRAQRESRVMNVIGFPCRPDPGDPAHRDAVLSMLYLRDWLTSSPGTVRPSTGVLGRHLANCVFSNPAAWVSAARQLWLRSRHPRLPFVLPYRARAQDALFFQAEHAPNPESRLLLSDARDDLGVPRITPRIRFSEIDYVTVKEFYRQLDRALRAHQLGSLAYDERGIHPYLDHLATHFHSLAHHLGTTRMSADPAQGVVDSDCRVHSLTNLYVAGSSVFPTSGHANPTLTVLALALRLADHVIERFRRSVAVSTGVAS